MVEAGASAPSSARSRVFELRAPGAAPPCESGGYVIAPGTQLWASQWVVHRDARWFPEPLAFRSERWGNARAKSLPRHADFPFGGGQRVCIGNMVAMMEAVLLLVTIARRFRLAPADRRPFGLTPAGTLRPTRAVSMIGSARLGAARRRPRRSVLCAGRAGPQSKRQATLSKPRPTVSLTEIDTMPSWKSDDCTPVRSKSAWAIGEPS